MMQFVIGRVIGYYYRIIDIDDIILNVFGGIVGYICMLPVKKIILKKININL
jgi:glycopeptide antibiotics resistance protein